jgi:hypothetical protein
MVGVSGLVNRKGTICHPFDRMSLSENPVSTHPGHAPERMTEAAESERICADENGRASDQASRVESPMGTREDPVAVRAGKLGASA